MKKAYAAVLLSAALLLPCCSRDMVELPEEGVPGTETGATDDTEQGYSLRLKVSDAGYRDGLTASRATDDGLTTTFEEGDVLGVYVVNGEGEILYSNVPYTLIGDEWLAPHNVRLKDFPLTVYAYYPYVKDEAMEGKVTAPATEAAADYTATDFFQPYLTELDITDQSTPELYRQADVMACKADIADEEAAAGPLTLTMDHQMGLVIINLPETVILTEKYYYLKGDKNYKWKVKQNMELPANLSEEFITIEGDIQPFKEETGYRYLCKPEENNIFFSGYFKTYESKKQYSVRGGVLAGSCKIYNVTVTPFASTSIGEVEYTPHVGDFYMNDGAILPSISENKKSDCVGIIFYTGNPNVANKTHGLVMGLQQMWSTWGPNQTTGLLGKPGDGFVGYTSTQILLDKYSGYAIVSAYNTMKVQEMDLPLERTTDWYLPSVDELLELHYSYAEVNESLSNLGTVSLTLIGYWSTGEMNEAIVYGVNLSNGSLYGDDSYKSNEGYVRLILAF